VNFLGFFPLAFLVNYVNPNSQLYKGTFDTLAVWQFWIAFAVTLAVRVLPVFGFFRLIELFNPSIREFAINVAKGLEERQSGAKKIQQDSSLVTGEDPEDLLLKPHKQ